MSPSKLAPSLGRSWQAEARTPNQNASHKAESKLGPLTKNVPLWIRIDRSDLTIARSESDERTECLTGRVSWIISCENKSTFATSLDALQNEPTGIGQIPYKSMPSYECLSAFAGFEIACSDYVLHSPQDTESELEPLQIHWPLDIEKPEQMTSKIAALRALSDRSKPIGISIPLSSLEAEFFESLSWLLECHFDWINWRLPAACLGQYHGARPYMLNDPQQALQKIRSWQASLRPGGRALPAIVIEYPWDNGYQASLLIREGADVVVLPHSSSIVRNTIEAIEANSRARAQDDRKFPSGSLGASLGFNTSAYLPSPSYAAPSTPAREPSSSEDSRIPEEIDLEQFVSQMIAYLNWSA